MVAFTAEEPPVTLPRGYSISRPFMASAVKPQSCRQHRAGRAGADNDVVVEGGHA